jgi:hypothetical protein
MRARIVMLEAKVISLERGNGADATPAVAPRAVTTTKDDPSKSFLVTNPMVPAAPPAADDSSARAHLKMTRQAFVVVATQGSDAV